jgi:hypothetical protein
VTRIDDVHLKLGQAIAGLCPPGFESARLGASLQGGRIGLSLRCLAGGWSVDIDPTPAAAEILPCLRAIRDDLAKDGSEPWTSASVTLRKGGHDSFDTD